MTLSCFKRAMKKHNKELWLLGGFSVKEAKCEVNKWVVIPRKSTTSLDKNTVFKQFKANIATVFKTDEGRDLPGLETVFIISLVHTI